MNNEVITKLLNEYDELIDKLIKLEKFISKQDDNFLCSKKGDLLVKQKLIMMDFRNILRQRIDDLLGVEVIE